MDESHILNMHKSSLEKNGLAKLRLKSLGHYTHTPLKNQDARFSIIFKGTVRPDYIRLSRLRLMPLRNAYIQYTCIEDRSSTAVFENFIWFLNLHKNLSYPLNSGMTVCMGSFFLPADAFYCMKKSAKISILLSSNP